MTAQQPTPPTGPYDPMFGLQEKVASLLTPVFQDARTSELFAYQIACRSLQAFEPETRADFLNAGRTIAFGLASMFLVQEVFNPDLQHEEKKKVAIHANALNRSADQSERSMMERRRYRRAYPTFPVPQEAAPEPEDEQPQVAEAATPAAPARPSPPKPEITPPIRIAPAMLHAVAPNSPHPHPS